VLRGEAAVLDVPFRTFASDLAIALRPHFFALSSIAALAGASAVSSTISPRVVLAALISGLGWGVGQLLNDLLDRETDSVNAPERAIATGRLPAGPTLVVAIVLGVVLVLGTALVHRYAWLLALVAALLVVVYNAAKRWPLLGNVAHAALMAVAAAIGACASLPDDAGSVSGPGSAVTHLVGAWRTLLLVGAIAAWYLQSNYEKDRPGDLAAGYVTLAVALPVRASAIVRGVLLLVIAAGAYRAGILSDAVSESTMIAGVVVGLFSTLGPIAHGTDAAALRAYRAAVPASILTMLALAAPLLGRWGTTVVLILALTLVWSAFRRSPNP
jgi:4-hydroxybenzoate polyprenyltransferase